MQNIPHTVYYLPGRGGLLHTGLGGGLAARGFGLQGRQTIGDFRSLPFQTQIDCIAQDLQSYFWTPDSRVVAVSYGAYLLLHALADLEPCPANVLLLSPIVGEFLTDDTDHEPQIGFVPPCADRLKTVIDAELFPKPRNCQIHTGSKDWQSRPNAVKNLADRLQIPLVVVEGAGHQLGKLYVSAVLDRWLD